MAGKRSKHIHICTVMDAMVKMKKKHQAARKFKDKSAYPNLELILFSEIFQIYNKYTTWGGVTDFFRRITAIPPINTPMNGIEACFPVNHNDLRFAKDSWKKAKKYLPNGGAK